MHAISIRLRSIALTLSATSCVGDPGAAAMQTDGDGSEATDDSIDPIDETHPSSMSNSSTSPPPGDDEGSPSSTTANAFPGDGGYDAGDGWGETNASEDSSSGIEGAGASEDPSAPPSCGDGQRDAGEECDDGNSASGDFCGHDCRFETRTYGHTGAPVTVVVPDWMHAMRVEVFGAEGGGSLCCDASEQDDGGRGGWARARYDVVPGETLTIFVGGKGVRGAVGGFNGGGDGGQWGGGGGGASDVRIGAATMFDRIIVAGGGGAGACGCGEPGSGGPGGGEFGMDGVPGTTGLTVGGGASWFAGGGAGVMPAQLGSFGEGGSASALDQVSGGGGGWYGGGSGYRAPGGGGSSWTGDGIAPDSAADVRVGHGLVVIEPAG